MPVFRKDGKNILFIHIPKTGGSTIETVFKNSGYQTLYLDGRVGRTTANYIRKCTPQHMHAEMLENNFIMQNFDASFMIVRHPLARFKSEYIWRNRRKTIGLDAKSVHKWAEKSFAEYKANNFIFDNHLRPQSEFYIQGTDVYRLEDSLGDVVEDLNYRHRLSLSLELPTLKEAKKHTGHSSRDVTVSDDLETRIREFYGSDYEMFKY